VSAAPFPRSSWLALLLLCGCQCTQSPDGPRAEGEPCDTDAQCASALCDKLPGRRSVCFRKCEAGCKANEVCTSLQLNDRRVCVPELPGLCQPCAVNVDCAYPGDRCADVGGGTSCTRDCSFDGQCPPSFSCADGVDSQGQPFKKQCLPTSGTCDCTLASSGQSKPCAQANDAGTCMGTQTCQFPSGYDACTAQTPRAEQCNGTDDDCNGQVDEGLGQLTCGQGECLRTVSACVDGGVQSCVPGTPVTELCDAKDNDCDGVVDNGIDTQTSLQHCGACNAPCLARPNAVPACVGGVCGVASCLPGFVDRDGDPANGCEYACTPSSTTDSPDLAIVDANCDGLDGEWGNAIFVAPPSAGGSDANPGTRTSPKATIAVGLAAAVAQSKRDVLVASGTYVEQIAVTSPGKGIYGGYTAGTWTRSLATAVTVTGVNTPLRITAAADTVVQAISFIGANATGAGVTAYGAFIVDSPGVRLEGLTVSAGDGSAGTNGSNGATGASGGAGAQGQPGCEDSGGFCSTCALPNGGAGGTSVCGRTGGTGGWPGNGGSNGGMGGTAVGGTPGGPGTPPRNGNWVTPSTYWGANGATPSTNGSDGASGGAFGTLSSTGYTRAATTGGGAGAHGNGGGGGGGGGGGDVSCNSYGGAGSGGGAGGCGGGGGIAGLSGGGSFAVFLWNSTVTATDCVLTSSAGGRGGNGGAGGGGGVGGNGGPRNAYGGSSEQDDGSNGGNGGRGGNGAAGGAGGAGGGGPTIGVVRGGGATWAATTTTITTGTAGAGGTSNAGAGATGLKQDVY